MMFIVILTSPPVRILNQLPTKWGVVLPAEYDSIDDVVTDLKGQLEGTVFDHQIWALNTASGETTSLNELLR